VSPSELLDYRLVGAVGIVFDVVAIDSLLLCLSKFLLTIVYAMRLERLHHANTAEPFAELGSGARAMGR